MPEVASAESLTQFLRSLRAVRQYQQRSVPTPVVDDILEVARWSGSASNKQPAEIVVVTDRGTLGKLAGLGGYVFHVGGAALAMIIVMPGEWEEGETFDEGRIAERIMLAALAHGVGSSIGWLDGAGRAEAKRLLGVPDKRLLRTIL